MSESNITRLLAPWLLSLLAAAAAADAPPPQLLGREACPKASDNYPQYVARQLATRRQEASAAAAQGLTMRSEDDLRSSMLRPQDYARRHRAGAVRCERLTYLSDGLRVVAYLWQPQRQSRARLPLIVFNRGGTLEDSKLRPNTQFGFYRFVEAGFVVIGTQYRGNDGGEGRDEMGGADVNDVLNLLVLARSFNNVDVTRVFAVGYSRGAMQTLLAAKAGASFRAVALVGLPANFTEAKRAGSDALYRKLIPDYERDPEAALRARSALLWADQLKQPTLLLAGAADPLVDTAKNSIAFAAKLAELRRPYELIVYDGDSHGLMFNGADRDARILAWFQRFDSVPQR